ncbi:hypothetical protein CGCF413_v015607 [Colletotrichum fructicola]|nr:hypothetical protein CGCF413_v015607 [Colletotrichum fructicola]
MRTLSGGGNFTQHVIAPPPLDDPAEFNTCCYHLAAHTPRHAAECISNKIGIFFRAHALHFLNMPASLRSTNPNFLSASRLHLLEF